jgi:hypothetical protein
MIGGINMIYLILHLVCALISILLQMDDSACNGTLALLYIITGPVGLITKLLIKIL